MNIRLFVTILLLSLGGLLPFSGYSDWTQNFIPVEQVSTAFSCPSIGHLYLNQDYDTDGLADQFLYLNSNFILQGDTQPYSAGQILRQDTQGTTKTKVRYYTPANNMVYKINENNSISPLDNSTFRRASWVFPYNTPIRGIATTTNKVAFERPFDNNPNKNTVGFYYDYVYKYAVGWDGTSSSSYRYNQVPNMSYLGNTYVTYITTLPGSYGNRKRARSTENTYSVCRNYKLHRCGDGIIDTYSASSRINTFSGEVCDDGPLNGQPGKCNITCSALVSTTPTCTLTANTNTIQPGQQVTLYGSYAHATNTTFSHPLSRTPGFQYPNRTGSTVVTPLQTTTYTLTAYGTGGVPPAICSTTITVQSLAPTCTLTVSSGTITQGQSTILSASYTNGVSATLTPLVSGLTTFTYPHRSSSTTISPSTTTTYTLTVRGQGGTNPAVCTATVTVLPSQPPLACTLTLTPNITTPGQIVTVGRNVINGNFFGTYIYVTPPLPGAWPHWVNANQYTGTSSVMPTQTGTYTFTMMVHNNTQSAICTGILQVVDNATPTCSLSTSTPFISSGQTGLLQASYANASLATFVPNIPGLNFTYPTRSNTNIQVFPTQTTTYTLHILGNGSNSGTSCSTTIYVQNTGFLTLTKELVTNILYHSGDLVTFKIHIANTSQSPIYNVVLTDYLPASLEYVSSQLYGIAPYTFGTGNVGANTYVEYSGFSLAPGQSGYLLLIGKVKGYQYINQTLNTAFAKGDNAPLVYASALFYIYTPSSHTTILKTSNKSSYYLGEQALFTIAVTNNGPDPISNLTLTDNWPNSPCVTLHPTWASNIPLTLNNNTNPYIRIYSGILQVGQTIYLYLTGNIGTASSCIGTYVNNAQLSYTLNNQLQTGSAPPLTFSVISTPAAHMILEKRLVSYGNNVGDPVVFELFYQNNGSVPLSYFEIVDYRPGTLNFISATPMPTTQTPDPSGMLLRWIIPTSLPPNGTGKIIINGTLK